MEAGENLVFIIGSPRSGTTILSELVGRHEHIEQWYEPYYVWERHLEDLRTDIYPLEELSCQVRTSIRRCYREFQRKADARLIVDKTPTHVFNIPFISQVFPSAKWIHIIRDGRDATLSISKEWEKRAAIVERMDFRGLARTARAMLARQPFWRYRLMAVFHELRGRASWRPSRYMNKARWRGYPGWGPRFPGWDTYVAPTPRIKFCAMQWERSVRAAQAGWPTIPEQQRLVVYYEDLLRRPEDVLQKIFSFCGEYADSDYFRSLPPLRLDNTQKWRTQLSTKDVERIRPVLTPLLGELGYLRTWPW